MIAPALAEGRSPPQNPPHPTFGYAVDLVGAEHVGIGLDYVFDLEELAEFKRKNPGLFPTKLGGSELGLVAPEAFGPIAEGLARTNMNDDQIRGILGGNWLRIATRVWR